MYIYTHIYIYYICIYTYIKHQNRTFEFLQPSGCKDAKVRFWFTRSPSRKYLSIFTEHRFLHQTGPEQSSRRNSWTDRLQIAIRVFSMPWKFWKHLGNRIKNPKIEGEGDMDVVITIPCYILPIDCLLITLGAHMLSHNGYGPGPEPMAQKGRSSSLCGVFFGPRARARAHIHYG